MLTGIHPSEASDDLKIASYYFSLTKFSLTTTILSSLVSLEPSNRDLFRLMIITYDNFTHQVQNLGYDLFI